MILNITCKQDQVIFLRTKLNYMNSNAKLETINKHEKKSSLSKPLLRHHGKMKQALNLLLCRISLLGAN